MSEPITDCARCGKTHPRGCKGHSERLGVAEVDLVAAVRDAWSVAVAEVVPREVRRLAIEGGGG